MTFARRIRERREQREAEKAANLRALCQPVKSLHRGTYEGGTSCDPVEKENALQHAGYMDAVRNLGYCMHCGIPCRPQFCHRDMGKGGVIKTDCREGWPGCDDCHGLLGGHKGGGRMPKEERRALELDLGRRTREAVMAAGTWPARLPMLETAA